jgi:hypothetical protein
MLDKLAIRIFGNVYNNLSDEKKSTILVVLAASLVISIAAILILEKDFLEDIAFLILIGLAFLPRFREFWSDVFGSKTRPTNTEVVKVDLLKDLVGDDDRDLEQQIKILDKPVTESEFP